MRPTMKRILGMTPGRCWYCDRPYSHKGGTGDRDWLLVPLSQYRFAREHKIPICRGGTDDLENILPSCMRCNRAKGRFTIDEFRLIRALRAGSLNYHFAYERPRAIPRDWLVCHSAAFERPLVIHNHPASKAAYDQENVEKETTA